jgi:hypothetical protein
VTGLGIDGFPCITHTPLSQIHVSSGVTKRTTAIRANNEMIKIIISFVVFIVTVLRISTFAHSSIQESLIQEIADTAS